MSAKQKVGKTKINNEKHLYKNSFMQNGEIVMNDTNKNMGAVDTTKKDVIFEGIRQLRDIKTTSNFKMDNTF